MNEGKGTIKKVGGAICKGMDILDAFLFLLGVCLFSFIILYYLAYTYLPINLKENTKQTGHDGISSFVVEVTNGDNSHQFKVEGASEVFFVPVFGAGQYTVKVVDEDLYSSESASVKVTNSASIIIPDLDGIRYASLDSGNWNYNFSSEDVNGIFENVYMVGDTFLISYTNIVDELEPIIDEVKSDSDIATIDNLFDYFADFSITKNGKLENTDILSFLANKSGTDFNFAVTLVAILRDAEIPARVLCTDGGYYIQAYTHDRWITYNVLSGKGVSDDDREKAWMML